MTSLPGSWRDPDPGVVCLRSGSVGRIVLDRPGARNALTLPMVQEMDAALRTWADQDLTAVTIESSSAQAFCAGGDVRRVRADILAGRPEAVGDFFAAEYGLIARLAHYTAPVVALVDGVCFGGGMGLSVHGPFLVASERAVLGMPETRIGFFPDVGGSHYLPRLPGNLGRYLALTGRHLTRDEAVSFGIVSHACSHEQLGTIPGRLADGERPHHILLSLDPASPASRAAAAPTAGRRRLIDWAFSPPSLEDVEERLRSVRAANGEHAEWARETLRLLHEAAPSSLRITDSMLAWGRRHTLLECLEAEWTIACAVTAAPDFIEGVDAVLVARDRKPSWNASSEVAGHIVEFLETNRIPLK